jgi:5-methylcytosine-specific restriction endonuclease McrA
MFGRGGPRHHMWKGGKIYYYGPDWDRQRNKARARDNYTCQHCGVTETQLSKELDVHHKIKFRIFGIEHYKEANDLTNLISLCNPCHIIAEACPQPEQA